MLRKSIICLAFVICSGSAHAASFILDATDEVKALINKGGGLQISDEQAAFLNKNHLGIVIDGDATVLVDTNVAWAVVHLEDPRNHIVGGKFGADTEVTNHGVASQDIANAKFYDAANKAVRSLDWNAAAAEMFAFRKIHR